MRNKQKNTKQKKSNKGMSTQNNTPLVMNTSPVGPPNAQNINANTSDVLGQSRDVLYGQDNFQSVPPSYDFYGTGNNMPFMSNMQSVNMQNNAQSARYYTNK